MHVTIVLGAFIYSFTTIGNCANKVAPKNQNQEIANTDLKTLSTLSCFPCFRIRT